MRQVYYMKANLLYVLFCNTTVKRALRRSPYIYLFNK